MPSFDVVSEVDIHDLTNAVDQASRVITNRFDFKGVDASFEREERSVTVIAEVDFQVQQMVDVLENAMLKCGIDVACMEKGDVVESGKQARMSIQILHGLDKEIAKKITKLIKETKLKVQSSVQGDQVRVTGKKRDDLQQVMAMLREAGLALPLQFNNFRD